MVNYRVIAKNKNKKWYKIYGWVYPGLIGGEQFHLATVLSLGNACMIAEKFGEMMYEKVTVE